MTLDTGITLVTNEDEVARSLPVEWAVSHLISALESCGVSVSRSDTVEVVEGSALMLAGTSSPVAARALDPEFLDQIAAPESFILADLTSDGREVLLAVGSDSLGLVYALTELADRVACASDIAHCLEFSQPLIQTPANRIRSIARYFCSDVEDKAWYHDRGFWERYLTMLATQRFNRFSLTLGLGYNFPRNLYDTYFYFAYPFLLDVPGYDVRVPGLPDEERERNFESLKYIAAETGRRGLQFQLALWTHAYEWIDSPHANYVIEGLTAETHAAYCRDALHQILEACPDITGVTFRIHGESGIPEGSNDFWQTVFEGIVSTGRKIEIDMHAKGLDEQMIDMALSTDLPIIVSPKYWAEHQALPMHQAAIREQEAPRLGREKEFMAFSGGARRFVRYSYGDLLREDRGYGVLYRIWAGTQRVLLWGDPAMAAGYGRCASLAGSDGMEFCEPLTFKGRIGSGSPGDRAGYVDESLAPGLDDWTKFDQTYRQIGRLLYDPEADPDGWRRALVRDLGQAAEPMERALAHASRILPLITIAHHPSASNNSYWPEIYTNMPLVKPEGHPYRDTPEPKVFNTVSPLDPATFSSIEEHAESVTRGESDPRYSPTDVAGWLDDFARIAETSLQEADEMGDQNAPTFWRMAVDIAIQAGLGRFFAEKLRAGVAYALWQRNSDMDYLRYSVSAYHRARDAWQALTEVASVYAPDLGYGQTPHLRGHWSDRLPAIDADLADLEALLEGDSEPSAKPITLGEPLRPAVTADHTPPVDFVPGEPVSLEFHVKGGPTALTRVSAHYRHVNQAESYIVAVATASGDSYKVEIPGDYTNSPYALQYWFELRDDEGNAGFWPGLDPDLSNQPYFVIRQRGFTP